MIRTERFRLSDRPYAVDLSSLTVNTYGCHQVDAMWFRRRRGVTVACAGDLHTGLYGEPAPVDARDFLTRYTDGRHGGHAAARWDGNNLWAPEMSKDEQDRYYELLKPMLDAYPEVPYGFDGWWTFQVPS